MWHRFVALHLSLSHHGPYEHSDPSLRDSGSQVSWALACSQVTLKPTAMRNEPIKLLSGNQRWTENDASPWKPPSPPNQAISPRRRSLPLIKRQSGSPRREGYSTLSACREALAESPSPHRPLPLHRSLSVGSEYLALLKEPSEPSARIQMLPISNLRYMTLLVMGKSASPQERSLAAERLRREFVTFLERKHRADHASGVHVRPALLLEQLRKEERQRQKAVEELVNKHLAFRTGLGHLESARRSLLEIASLEDNTQSGAKGGRTNTGFFSGNWSRHVERIFAVVDPTSEVR